MKVKITRKFVADDGMEFNSAKDCELYENIYTRVRYANDHALNKSDFDFIKDVFSAFLTQAETVARSLKEEALFFKSQPENIDHKYSDMCFADLKKLKLKIKKLAELQRKIKRMRSI